jgi:hypothetical protein
MTTGTPDEPSTDEPSTDDALDDTGVRLGYSAALAELE